jgi:hypothetical protein
MAEKGIVHSYIIGFVPIAIVGIAFVVSLGNSTDRIANAVEDLTQVVDENTKRGISNSENIAVLDNRVGYLEGK